MRVSGVAALTSRAHVPASLSSQQCTQYGDSVSADDRVIRDFWRVLESFSELERTMYLRFVWGRSRLPINRAGFSTLHKINYLRKEPADRYLPIAHVSWPCEASRCGGAVCPWAALDCETRVLPLQTCFFSIDCPRYSTIHVMRERLRYCIMNCQEIDADNTSTAARAAVASRRAIDELE
jgi:hypothetical protein